jgi:hypothetical protein
LALHPSQYTALSPDMSSPLTYSRRDCATLALPVMFRSRKMNRVSFSDLLHAPLQQPWPSRPCRKGTRHTPNKKPRTYNAPGTVSAQGGVGRVRSPRSRSGYNGRQRRDGSPVGAAAADGLRHLLAAKHLLQHSLLPRRPPPPPQRRTHTHENARTRSHGQRETNWRTRRWRIGEPGRKHWRAAGEQFGSRTRT